MKCGNAALASIKLLSATQFSLSSDEEGASDEDNRSPLTVWWLICKWGAFKRFGFFFCFAHPCTSPCRWQMKYSIKSHRGDFMDLQVPPGGLDDFLTKKSFRDENTASPPGGTCDVLCVPNGMLNNLNELTSAIWGKYWQFKRVGSAGGSGGIFGCLP